MSICESDTSFSKSIDMRYFYIGMALGLQKLNRSFRDTQKDAILWCGLRWESIRMTGPKLSGVSLGRMKIAS